MTSDTFSLLWRLPKPGTRYNRTSPAASPSLLTSDQVLLSSPRNSVAGHLSLIEQAGCEVWFTTTGVGKFDFVKLPIVKVPEVNELIDKKTVKAHPYDRQWPRDRKDPFVTLHSTGSTGMPRVIQLTMDHAASGDALASVDRIEGKLPTLAEWAGTKMLNGMPQFHVSSSIIAPGVQN